MAILKNLLVTIAIILMSCTAGLKYPVILDEIDDSEFYEKANALIVFDSTNIKLARDGTATTISHRLVKVFNALGRKEFSEASFGYITLYDTVVVLEANVIKPDKKVIKAPKDAITDMPMPAWEGSKFYIPNLRIVKITFPELEDGGAVEYRVKTITHNAPFDSTYDNWDLFELTEPIKSKTLTISLPENMPLKWVAENGGLSHKEEKSGQRIIHTWQVNDVPKIVMEPSMPPLNNVATKLLLTCTNSWQDYSNWYYKICESKLKPDSAINEKVNELTKDCKIQDDVIRVLYEFVNKEIRYVETELLGKKGGFEPAPVSFTFKNKYGVCRDKAALLVSLLRTAGIKDSYMVLTNPFILNMGQDMPVASQFNHAIVAIKADTGFSYLDPTAENSVEYLISYEDDKPVLVSTEKGEGISKTPKRLPDVNLSVADVVSELKEDGTLTQVIKIKTSGMIDMQFRWMCQMMPKEQIEQVFLSTFKASYPKTKLDSLKTTDPKDFETPMELLLFLTIPDYVLKIGKEWHLTPGKGQGSLSGTSGIWNLSERKYPLYLWVSMANRIGSVLWFPKNLRVKSLPSNYEYEDATIMVNVSYKLDKNVIIERNVFVIKKPLISPDEYLITKKCMEELEEHQNEEIILEQK